jgi:NAD(P)-dependent dehydrogenase (short-subunit alcohol dehydrogenase family)
MSARRIAVVTGANRGLGREVARELAARDFRVIATARALGEARAATGDFGAEPLELDVTRQDQIDALAQHLPTGVDVLVNNAGVSLDGFNADVARRTLDVNFFGAMHVTDALLPVLRERGRIVMVSSGMGALSCLAPALQRRFADASLTRAQLIELMRSFTRDVEEGIHTKMGWPSSAYSVSKVGLNALTRIVARELAKDPRHVLVNAGSPGWVKTRMGGSGAPRSVEQGAHTLVWLATLPDGGPSGGFFQDERAAEF